MPTNSSGVIRPTPSVLEEQFRAASSRIFSQDNPENQPLHHAASVDTATVRAHRLLSFGLNAVENGEAIAHEAGILAEHKCWSRATALLITAGEEVAKGYFATLMSIGVVQLTDGKIKALRRKHGTKQGLARASGIPSAGDIVAAMSPLAQHLRGILVSGPSPVDVAVQHSIARSETFLNENPAVVSTIKEHISSGWAKFKEETASEASEKLRQRALYVDINPTTFESITPRTIGEPDYGARRQEFDQLLPLIELVRQCQMTLDQLHALRIAMALQREILARSQNSPEVGASPGSSASPPDA